MKDRPRTAAAPCWRAAAKQAATVRERSFRRAVFCTPLARGFLLAWLSLLMAAAAPAGDIAIVAHPAVPVDDLPFSEVRKLVMGDRQYWSRGLRVTLLMSPPGTAERGVILKNVYGMNENQYRVYWLDKEFRAEASEPRAASSEVAADLVGKKPGAVAFLDVSKVPRNLKVLKIDGHMPGDKGYPLH